MSLRRGRQASRWLISTVTLLILGGVGSPEARPLSSATDDLDPTLPDYLAEARRAVERKAWTEAAGLLERAAWAQGTLGEVARMASQVYEELGHDDQAASQALLDYSLSSRDPDATTKDLRQRIARIKQLSGKAGEMLDVSRRYVDDLVKMARSATGKRNYRTAVRLYRQVLDLEPQNARALKAIAELGKKKGATTAAAVLRQKLTDSIGAEKIARMDQRHRDMRDAYEMRTEHYKIQTNIGYRALQGTATYLEQAHRFYRDFYGFPSGSKRALVNVLLFRTAEEFDEFAEKSGRSEETRSHQVQAFFSTAGPVIVGWDPRDRGATSLWSLYRTLFHEASHQFVYDLTKGADVKSYLDEGTASYFEGVEVLDDGSVDFNYPTHHLGRFLAWSGRSGRPSLREVIQDPFVAHRSENYTYGWALVYFCRNYEDQDGDRPFEKPLLAAVLSYKKQPRDHVKRFEKYFVEPGILPGVDSVEAFESYLRDWYRKRQVELTTPALMARSLIERSRRQRSRGRLEDARRGLERALRLAPTDVEARQALAQVLEEEGSKDEALHHWHLVQRQLTAAHGSPDPDATISIESLDPLIEERGEAEGRFFDDTLLLSGSLQGADLPLVGMWGLRQLRRVFGSRGDIQDSIDRIEIVSDTTLRSWRLISGGRDLLGWSGAKAGRFLGTGREVQGLGDRQVRRQLIHGDWLQGDFEFRVKALYGAETFSAGLLFGMKRTGEGHALELLGEGWCDLYTIQEKEEDFSTLQWSKDQRYPGQKNYAKGWSELYIEVADHNFRYFVDGKLVLSREFPPGVLAGSVGLFYNGGQVRFRDPELRY